MEITEQFKADIYRDYYNKVFGYVQGKLCDSNLAQDITSDIFLKVYEKIGTFDDTKASISTWIFTIMRNTLTDYYRSKRNFSEIPETMPSEDSIEDSVCRKEMLERLSAALAYLDEREREIIVMHFYTGRTLKDIAEDMGISYAYVKVLQGKALSALKDYLE
ncbi:MAG: sigma-70 family RNA polymerase sigma factor [Clostridiales bacterium]|nr:sigma-70 family RNA polymerase sigma factor [Clostridiales bacterium]